MAGVQLLYIGVTEKCHPTFLNGMFGALLTTGRMKVRYIDKVLKPYIHKKKQELGLADDSKTVIVWDVFRAHRTQPALEKLRMEVVLVPANCTSELIFQRPLEN